jgi:ABC-type sugar transport system permease subunit
MGNEGGAIDTGAGGSAVAEIVSAADLQNLFSNMVVGSELAVYVTDMVNNIFDIVNRSGVQMLIFLSGLQGISPAIYESCQIEGCSAWETFWKITLPMISPMILVNAVYTIIDSFTSESNEVMNYIAQVYATPGVGNVLSSAMSWMYFLIVILIVAVVAMIFSMFVFYQRRD